MNKTHTINISSMVFHIDEYAYEKLKVYLNTIRSYFNNNEVRDEIMADIEARIAEIFSAKINLNKQVILLEDVNEMIAIMGNPEVFKNDDDAQGNAQQANEKEWQYNGGNVRKRIFRDPDDKVLGGVCGGIGNYIGIDPVWLRLLFAVLFFFFGSGFLFYIILWIVIPEAKTTADKIEMRGERVNINTIEKNFKEEMEGLKKRFKGEPGNQGSSLSAKFKTIISRMVDLMAQLLSGLGKALLKIIGFLFVFFGIIFLVIVMSSIFGNSTFLNINSSGISSIAYNELFQKIFNSAAQIIEIKIALFLLIGIPLLMFTYAGIKIILKLKTKHKWLNYTSVILWLIGLALCIHVLGEIDYDFRQRSVSKQSQNLPVANLNTLYLQMPDDFSWGGSHDEDDETWWYDNQRSLKNYAYSSGGLNFNRPLVDVQKSLTDSFEVVVIKSAKGKNKKEALRRAEKISYSYFVKDSMLIFNPRFEMADNEKWRAQKVKIIVKVPIGKAVFLDKNVRPLIYDIDNVTNTYDGDMVNHTWVMRKEGLSCLDCGQINGYERKSQSDNSEDEENNF